MTMSLIQRSSVQPARHQICNLPTSSQLFTPRSQLFIAAPHLRSLWTSNITCTPAMRSHVLAAAAKKGGKADITEEEEEFEEIDGDEDFVDDVDDDDADDYEDNVGPEINTYGTDWGDSALKLSREMLPVDGDLQLFSLRALKGQNRLDIRLDKLSDEYGSPTLDEVEIFSRSLSEKMEAELGEAADIIEIEVSSPGAERVVRVPSELTRFEELPMKVEYIDANDGDSVQTRYFDFYEYDEATQITKWRLADIKINRAAKGKGRTLNKKERETVVEIPVSAIQKVNLHVDV